LDADAALDLGAEDRVRAPLARSCAVTDGCGAGIRICPLSKLWTKSPSEICSPERAW